MTTPPDFVNATALDASSLNSIGLWLVKSQTVGSSNVNYVELTNVFSSTYDSYLISWSNITSSASGVSMTVKLLVGTTPNASNWTGNSFYIVPGAAGALTNASLNNSAFAEIGNIDSTYKNSGFFNLQQPNIASATYAQYSSADNAYWRQGAFILKNSTQYDGIRLGPYSGTITGGTIRVYGYRN